VFSPKKLKKIKKILGLKKKKKKGKKIWDSKRKKDVRNERKNTYEK